MNITDDNNTYVIKLDELDLNYFYLNFPTKTSSPIWNINSSNLGNYDYREFVVDAKKLSDLKSTTCVQATKGAVSINLSTYKCLLCNANIPSAYKKEHNSSLKHEIFSKIAQIALERSKSLLAAIENDSISPDTSGTYFCKPCNIAVDVSEQIEHDLSKIHRNSLLHERCLNDLLLIYEDVEYLDRIEFKYSDYCDKDVISVSEDTASFADSNEVSTLDNSEYESIRDESEDDRTASKNHAKELGKDRNNDTENSTPNWFLTKDDDDIRIEALDKCVLQVPFDNYHGFYSSSGQTHCRVCRVAVYTGKLQHIHSAEHLERISPPLENKHCLRKIDATKYYCIVCNDTLDNVETHKVMPTHKFALDIAMPKYSPTNNQKRPAVIQKGSNEPKPSSHIIKEENDEVTATSKLQVENSSTNKMEPSKPKPSPKVEQTYCQACKIFVDLHNFKSHTAGRNHKINFEAFADSKNTTATHQNNKDIRKDSNISNSEISYADKVKKEPSININASTAKINNGKTFCEPCRIHIDTHNIDQHSLGKNHKMNLEIFANEQKKANEMQRVASTSKANNTVTSTVGKTYCEPCQIHIDTHNFNQHTAGRNHKVNFDIFKVGKAYCEPCGLFMHANNVKSHNSGKNHKIHWEIFVNKQKATESKGRLEASTHTGTTSSAKPNVQIGNTDNIKKETANLDATTAQNKEVLETKQINLHYHLKITDGDVIMCKVCEVKVPTHDLNIQEHVQGRSHRVKYAELLKTNKIIKRDDCLYCENCSINIADTKEFRHIKRHRIVQMYDCKYCNNSVSVANREIHESEVGHIIAIEVDKMKTYVTEWKLSHSFKKSKSLGTVVCKVCEVAVQTDNAEQHLTSPNHISNREDLLEEHMIIEFDDNMYMCEYCGENFSEAHQSVLDHIRGAEHLDFKDIKHNC